MLGDCEEGVMGVGGIGGHHSQFGACGSYSVTAVVLKCLLRATMCEAHSFHFGCTNMNPRF